MKLTGKNITDISIELELDRKTVRKYYRMAEEEYHSYQKMLETRDKLLDPFREEIIRIYQDNDNIRLNMAGVYDYLMELHQELPVSEKSLRNLINHMTAEGELTLKKSIRQYSKVPQLPYGKQLQLDFGYFTTPSGLKIYIFAAVLSASRYKCVFFHDKPFTTQTLIEYLLDCFDFIGGIPREIVIDQDKIMVVSENAGDIVYTKDFDTFKSEMGFSMYVCRKADPESKGKVENLVKFVKNNFLKLRVFQTLEEYRLSLSGWLNRRANGRISYATGKIPSLLHTEERKHLNPVKNSIFRKDRTIHREKRQVNEHSFISHSASQYSVPVKYRLKEVDIYSTGENLLIYDPKTGEEVARHTLSLVAGQKISSQTHFRENDKPIDDFKSETMGRYDFPEWRIFVERNFRAYSRFVRDQCILCRKLIKTDMDIDILQESVKLCLSSLCVSFQDLKLTYDTILAGKRDGSEEMPVTALGAVHQSKYRNINVQKRDIQEYQNSVEGLS
jgi:transposase